ncbi:MAG TPA: hypothetical protein VGL94_03690 [Ktedonobacteraceae bacterium]
MSDNIMSRGRPEKHVSSLDVRETPRENRPDASGFRPTLLPEASGGDSVESAGHPPLLRALSRISTSAFPKSDNSSQEPDIPSREPDNSSQEPDEPRGYVRKTAKSSISYTNKTGAHEARLKALSAAGLDTSSASLQPETPDTNLCSKAHADRIALVNAQWRANRDASSLYSSRLTEEPEQTSHGPSTQTEASRPRASTIPGAPKDRKVSFDEKALKANAEVIHNYRQRSDPQ